MSEKHGAALCVNGLKVDLTVEGSPLRIVDDVNLRVEPGQCLGVVGESGSGKTMTALAIAGLVRHIGGIVDADHMSLGAVDLLALKERDWVDVRGREIGFMFQQPSRSLHPSFTVGHQISESVRRNKKRSRRAAKAEAVDLLDRVGISEPSRRARQYPHEFSGGMAQRAMLAIALAGEPKLLIADEPTSALDVTIQEQIMELLDGIRQASGIAMIVITHDLGVAANLSQRISVMYAGQVMEHGPADSILRRPEHPYTRGLLASMPRLGGELPTPIKGMVPSPSEWTFGCRFGNRCDHFRAGVCDVSDAPLAEAFERHGVRCVRLCELPHIQGSP